MKLIIYIACLCGLILHCFGNVPQPQLLNTRSVSSTCQEINELLRKPQASENDEEQPSHEISPEEVCTCYDRNPASDDVSAAWIGCTYVHMPKIYRALRNLNRTVIDKLRLWNNMIPAIPTQFFGALRPKTLVIENCDLVEVMEDAFTPLGEELTTLELTNNKFVELNPVMFSSLNRLQRLDMSMNSIALVKPHTFDQLQNLQMLSLYKNRLDQLPDGIFAALGQLKILNLAYNNLSEITDHTFDGLVELEELNLEHNHIEHIAAGAFAGLKKLRVLNLGNNRLTKLTVQNISTLEIIYLNENAFDKVEQLELDGLTALIAVFLDKNAIERLPSGAFNNLPNLRSLSFTYNKLKEIEADVFRGVPALETLSLQNNQIRRVQRQALTGLTELRHLFLTQNQLEQVDERDLAGLEKLRVLSLASNQLANVHKRAFSGLFNLEKLYINNNKLSSLENNTLTYVQGSLQAIDLSDNPWSCACDLQWLCVWVNSHVAVTLNVQKTMCTDSGFNLSAAATVVADNCMPGHADRNGIAEHVAPLRTREPTSTWITILGVTMGLVSLLIMLGIGFMYWQDRGKRSMSSPTKHKGMTATMRSPQKLKRVPSDTVLLITEQRMNVKINPTVTVYC